MDDMDSVTLWEQWASELAKHQDSWSALHEYMVAYFYDSLEVRLKEQLEKLVKLDPQSEEFQMLNEVTDAAIDYQFARRPTVGLRLNLIDMGLTIRPGWRAAKRNCLGKKLLGQVNLDVIHLELLGPGNLLELKLHADKISTPRLNRDMAVNKKRLDIVLDTVDDLLMDPMALFSRQADRCVNCHKPLTDDVSRTRGIGPECIRLFACFNLPPPSKVAEYRYRQQQQYLADTGFLPGL